VHSGVTSQGNMRDPALSPPWIENFEEGDFLPGEWEVKSGVLDMQNGLDLEDGGDWYKRVFTPGYGIPQPTSEDWAGVIFGGVTNGWLISPPIDLGDPGHGNKLRFLYTTPNGVMDSDDKLSIVILDEDDNLVANDPVLAEYTSFTVNNLVNNAVHDLSAYSGVIKLAFYAESVNAHANPLRFYLDQIEVSADNISPTAPKIRTSIYFGGSLTPLFRWTASAGNPDGYEVYIREENEDWQLLGSTEHTHFQTPVPGLIAGINLDVAVRAYNSQGGADSDPESYPTGLYLVTFHEPHSMYFINFDHAHPYMPHDVVTDFELYGEGGWNDSPAACAYFTSFDTLRQFRTPALLLPSQQATNILLYYKYRFETLESIFEYEFEEEDSLSIWVSTDLGRSYQWLKSFKHHVQPGEDFTQGAISFEYPETDSDFNTVTFLWKVHLPGEIGMRMYFDEIIINALTTPYSIESEYFGTEYDFGDVWVGGYSYTEVQLTAPGGFAIIKELSLVGDDASEFMIEDIAHTVTSFNTWFNFPVHFKPHTIGQKNATLRIVDGLDNVYEIGLTGNGAWPGPVPAPVFVNLDSTDSDDWNAINMLHDEIRWDVVEDPDNPYNNVASIISPEIGHNEDAIISPIIILQEDRTYEFRVNYKNTPNGDPVDFALVYMHEDSLDYDQYISNIPFDNITSNDWGLARMTVDQPQGGNFAFMIYTGECSGSGILYIDNVRLTTAESDIVSIISDFDNGVCHLKPAPMWNEEQDGEYIPEATLTGISNIGLVEGLFEWKPPQINIPKRTLVVTLHGNEGASLAGADLVINHNLGYTPHRILRKIDNGGYEDIFNPEDGSWDSGKIALPSEEGALIERMQIVFFEEPSGHTPVSFAGFTAQITSENNVKINWTTLSETGMLGFYLYRANSEELDQAGQVSTLIPAHNSSQTQNYSFTDLEITQSGDYYYWLSCVELDGQTAYHGPCHILVNQSQDPQTPSLPLVTELLNPWPNPFNPDTNIPFSLHKDEGVTLEIYNLRGQKITTLLDENKAAGRYQVVWNAKDSNGRELSSGVYMLRMKAGKYQSDRKLMLVK